MDRPTSGAVRLEGESLDTLNDDGLTRVRRERVGFVFQFFNLLPTLTVEQNIGLPLLLRGRSVQSVANVAGQWAERVGISHRLNHFPSQLSGGEAQRVAIARAVIHQPALILADEPTGNLDSETGRTILDVLIDVNRDSGAALLLATHDPAVAAAAGEVIQMRDGLITRDAS
jgi:putative ABC transport system ATP-binding protein